MGDLTQFVIPENAAEATTDRDMNFLLQLDDKELATLLIAFRERIENRK